jgi:hypothetical protein
VAVERSCFNNDVGAAEKGIGTVGGSVFGLGGMAGFDLLTGREVGVEGSTLDWKRR